MTFGRRTQPPGGEPPPPRPQHQSQREKPRTVEPPSLQSPEPEQVNANAFPASKEFTRLLLANYGDRNGNVHAPSVIGAAAALTGEFAQRAGGVALNTGKPGYVFGDAINAVLLEGGENGQVTVWHCLQRAARDAGLAERDLFDPIDVVKNIANAVGGPSFPPLTVPRQHYPHEYSPNACVRLRPRVIAIADQFNLSRRDLAIALAISIYQLILLTKDVLPPAVSVRLAAEIAFGVAKMNPLNEVIG
jgi:hypothetical protein